MNNMAVQLYSSAPSNPYGIPGVWPCSVVELGESTVLPGNTYQLMTWQQYQDYLFQYRPVYDAWYVQYLQNVPSGLPQPEQVVVTSLVPAPPFAAKASGTKKFYKRVCGIQADLVVGDNDVVFTIGFPWVKITGMEIIGADIGDVTDFLVLDTAAGLVSGVPRYVLNQFGFGVALSKDYYSYKSEYDADLYYDMQVKCVITTTVAKKVGVNFILNEVK